MNMPEGVTESTGILKKFPNPPSVFESPAITHYKTQVATESFGDHHSVTGTNYSDHTRPHQTSPHQTTPDHTRPLQISTSQDATATNQESTLSPGSARGLTASFDSAVSTMSSPSAGSNSPDSRVFSSPSASERSKSSPKRTGSPDNSRAAKKRLERSSRTGDIDESRPKVRSSQQGVSHAQHRIGGEDGVNRRPTSGRVPSGGEDGVNRRPTSGRVPSGGEDGVNRRPTSGRVPSGSSRAKSYDSDRFYSRQISARSCDTSSELSRDEDSDRFSKRKRRSKSEARTSRTSKEPTPFSQNESSTQTSPVSKPNVSSLVNKFERVPNRQSPPRTANPNPNPNRQSARTPKSPRNQDTSTVSDPKEPRRATLNPRARARRDLSADPYKSSNSSRSRPGSAKRPVSLSETPLSSGAPERQQTEAEVEKRTAAAMRAMNKDGLPDVPSLEKIAENANESSVIDWRGAFRMEMVRLRTEVNDFRNYCQGQIKFHANTLRNSWGGTDTQNGSGSQLESGSQEATVLTELELNNAAIARKQRLLDMEEELQTREERLDQRQEGMVEYEKEIQEVESMLNHRQAICDRRQKMLSHMDEDLATLRSQLEETKEQIQSDGSIPESNTERARKNWDMLRVNLMDRAALLETTVTKYRSELAAARSTLAGKDILIGQLQRTVIEHEDELNNKEKRIRQLESKLSLAIKETHALNNSTRDLNPPRSATPSSDTQSSFLPPRSVRDEQASSGPRYQDGGNYQPRHSLYRRPSSMVGSESAEEIAGGIGLSKFSSNGDTSPTDMRMGKNGPSRNGKRNSVTDNAISRLTISPPQPEDKLGSAGGSSACVVQ